MKLIIAVVNDEDSHKVMSGLNKEGFSVTKLCSTGGFLRSGNTTLLTGVEENRVDDVIEIIKKKSKSRTQYIQPSIASESSNGVYYSTPVEVVVGGATIFVTNVERFEKV